MKVKFKETIEKEVELTVPCYRKDDSWVVKIISDGEFIQVNILASGDDTNQYFIAHRKGIYTRITDYFGKGWGEATEEEFETMLRETKRRLIADVNAQIFQQEKAA